ncbi:Lrp/AsnC family transcriptional regulator [Jiangella rhizosphaerae]|uniref:Lrp/AsnC family transcriptional regulator n=1 Tax=Jiangella rhizosphaerae TaxID=2293569 RepID=A0A418KND1_9ACTN|nr:Lrp/AsnC family transcriptional regulator [Jiangella rhizosphaerae]
MGPALGVRRRLVRAAPGARRPDVRVRRGRLRGERLAEATAVLAHDPRVVTLEHVTGDRDLLLTILVPDLADLAEFLLTGLPSVPGSGRSGRSGRRWGSARSSRAAGGGCGRGEPAAGCVAALARRPPAAGGGLHPPGAGAARARPVDRAADGQADGPAAGRRRPGGGPLPVGPWATPGT